MGRGPRAVSWAAGPRVVRWTAGLRLAKPQFFVFFLKNYPPIFVLLSVTPSPKKQSYLKDKPLKKRFGIIVLFYIRTKSLCI